MEYTIEDNRLFRILDNGSRQQLGWVIDNGRGDALSVNITPIKDEWLEECKRQGIPSHKKNQPIPFWDDGKDVERAFNEFYANKQDIKDYEYIFPVLKESEDEKIRKDITKTIERHIEHVFQHESYAPDAKDFLIKELKGQIAWLEKQGTPAKLSEEEQNRFAKGVLSRCALSFIDYLDAHKYEGKMCVSNGECEDIENAFHNAMWDRLHRYYCKYIEKQGEQKEYTFKSLPRLLDMIEPTSKAKAYCQKLIDTLVKEGYFTDAKIVGECLKKMNGEDVPMAIMDEKQGNKEEPQVYETEDGEVITYSESEGYKVVEPKFKVGDWIVNNERNNIVKVLEVNEQYRLDYCCDTIGTMSVELIDNDYHLWTIQDAKDGDVLVGSEWDVILMFRGIGNTEWDDVIDYHCYYDYCQKNFIVQKNLEYWGNTENNQLKPATKEQCDLLFQKMKESGYEWDAEKKELKKIHNALEECEIEHIEHGKYYYCIKDYFAGGKKQASKGDVVQALRGLPIMALGVKANEYFLPVNSIKQKPAWSEEDDKMFNSALWHIKNSCSNGGKNSGEFEVYNWLKSLKDRYTWKPSDEHISRLGTAINYLNSIGAESSEIVLKDLLEQLKKL